MNDRPLYLAAYDVSDPSRLRRALHVVRNYSTGGQKSVYECFLSKGEKAQLIEEIEAVIDSKEDRFFLLRLNPGAKFETLGIAEKPRDTSYFYIG